MLSSQQSVFNSKINRYTVFKCGHKIEYNRILLSGCSQAFQALWRESWVSWARSISIATKHMAKLTLGFNAEHKFYDIWLQLPSQWSVLVPITFILETWVLKHVHKCCCIKCKKHKLHLLWNYHYCLLQVNKLYIIQLLL